MNKFIFNTDLSLALPNRIRQACFNFLRNAEAAFDEYCDARTDLLRYLRTRNRTVAPYFSALRHFEHSLAHLYHAVLSVNVWQPEKQFEANDGSVLDRVRVLHNHVKHMDRMYRNVEIRDENSFKLFATRSDGSRNISHDVRDIANVPVWLVNSGLECRQASLTYSELADEITSVLGEAGKTAALRRSKTKASPPNSK